MTARWNWQLPPPVTQQDGDSVSYVRFSGYGTESDANVYIVYTATEKTTTKAWADTGIVIRDISVFNLANPSVQEYVDTVSYDNKDYTVSDVGTYAVKDYYRKDLPLPVFLAWDGDQIASEYVVSIDTAPSISKSTSKKYYTDRNRISIYNLVPGTTYYYVVYALCVNSSAKQVKSGSFTTRDKTRMLNIDGIQNVRDIGGYTGLDGKTVKYGLLFRGSAMDEAVSNHLSITDKGRQEMLLRVGIRTDLDLRYGFTKSPLDVMGRDDLTPEVDFINTSSGYDNYATAFTNATQRKNFAALLESIVTQLTNNKPIYFHCQGGCDRTGTLAFQLLGLLGVSESDLAKEYELSSFSAIGYTRTRNSEKYTGMVDALKAYTGDTITDKLYAFAINAADATNPGCGISADTITRFRALMLA